MPPWLLIQCLHPGARFLLLALLLGAIVHIPILHGAPPRRRAHVMLVYAILMLLTGFVGSYAASPLLRSPSGSPVGEFLVTQPRRGPVSVTSGEIISMAAGSVIEIQPRLLRSPADCAWSSANGGALDEPFSCDTAYAAPGGAPFDVLRVRLRPVCGGLPTVQRIRISILP